MSKLKYLLFFTECLIRFLKYLKKEILIILFFIFLINIDIYIDLY